MKITFFCDNNANIHSERKESFTPADLGMDDEEWKSLNEEEKHKYVNEWAMERFDYWFTEE